MRFIHYEKWTEAKRAKKYAATQGHHGQLGGWIYTKRGIPICQGWGTYYNRYFPWITGYINKKIRERDEYFANRRGVE